MYCGPPAKNSGGWTPPPDPKWANRRAIPHLIRHGVNSRTITFPIGQLKLNCSFCIGYLVRLRDQPSSVSSQLTCESVWLSVMQSV